jgi:hypothetical protein
MITKISSSSRRVFLAGVDAAKLFDLLETAYTDTGGKDGTAYRRLYADTLQRGLQSDGGEAEALAELLNALDAWALVEANVRRAAFIVGFDTCRQLLLGELDLEALKTGGEK